MQRKNVFRMIAVLFFIGAFAALSLTTPALAQKAQELKDAAQMMSDGWKMFNDGQRMVIKGKEMNNLVAVQLGLESQMAPGNKVIQDGRNTDTQAVTLFAQGEKVYLDNKSNPSVAKQGLQMMRDAYKIADDGANMINKGMAMNDQVAQEKGAVDKFAQGNKVIQDGRATMAQGAQLFMQGEGIFLKLK
jgi:hypothetical protein